jgi:hypothetical protein
MPNTRFNFSANGVDFVADVVERLRRYAADVTCGRTAILARVFIETYREHLGVVIDDELFARCLEIAGAKVDANGNIVPKHAGARAGTNTTAGTGARTVRMSDVQPKAVKWLWEDRFPLGGYSTLDGNPGDGKTLVLMTLAAKRSRGLAMPGEREARPASNTLILTAEDSLEQTIRPRLDAANANLDRVFCLTEIETADGGRPVSLPEDLPFIEREIGEKSIEQVLFDPFPAFFGEDVDAHVEASVRRVMHAVKNVAEKTGAGFIGARHLNKASNVSDPIYRGTGSIAISAASRSLMLAARHPDDDDKIVLARSKGNLSARPDSLEYKIVERGGSIAIEWLGSCELTAYDLLVKRQGREHEERDNRKVRTAGTKLLLALDHLDRDRQGITKRKLRDHARISQRDLECAALEFVEQGILEVVEIEYRFGRGHARIERCEGLRRRLRES